LNGNLRIYSDLMFAKHSTMPLYIFIMESIWWTSIFFERTIDLTQTASRRNKIWMGKEKHLKSNKDSCLSSYHNKHLPAHDFS
jgi:hypothetical protein